MASLLTYSAAHRVVRCANSIVPTSITARHILIRAGFDTPISTTNLQQQHQQQQQQQQQANISTSAAPPCPLVGSNGISSSSASVLPSVFAGSSRCPCGLYPANGTPLDCPSATTTTTSQSSTHTILRSSTSAFHAVKSSPTHARAFSTVAAATSNTSTVEEKNQPTEPHVAVKQPSPAAPAPSTPAVPPPACLNSAYSSAHASLLAIDDYRTGVQSLNRGSLASARSLLERTRDIVCHVPHPSMSLFVRHLLAGIAGKQARFIDEKMIRIELLKEFEKTWLRSFSSVSASSPKDSDLILANHILSSALLSCLRVAAAAVDTPAASTARAELVQLVESWLPKMEAALFGRPPSPTLTRAASQPTPQPFTTGATHLRALALYTTLIEAALYERATRPAGSPLASKQPIFERSVAQLSKLISSRPYLASSQEWKMFIGELILLPKETLEVAGVKDLLPVDVRDATTDGARALGAVAYFEGHPELQKHALSETNMTRDWYAPLGHAYLLAFESNLGVDGAKNVTRSPSSLLDACLTFVEKSVSEDPSHPMLLRTLLPLSLQAMEDGEAIQAEGLLRNILARWESSLALHDSVVRIDSYAMSAYLDALLEYVHLLTKLEWNKVSRKNEARSVMFQKLLKLIRQDSNLRKLVEGLLPTARRTFQLPTPGEMPERTEDITDDMLELPIQNKNRPVPQWLVEKLHVGDTALTS